MDVFADGCDPDCGSDFLQIGIQRFQTGERQFDDGDTPRSNPLLITQILVAGEKDVEFAVNQTDQLAILFTRPSLKLHRDHLELREEMAQCDGQVLIKQDCLHGRVS